MVAISEICLYHVAAALLSFFISSCFSVCGRIGEREREEDQGVEGREAKDTHLAQHKEWGDSSGSIAIQLNHTHLV